MKLNREELVMEKVNSWNKRQKWMPRIYMIVLLFVIAVYATLMNYSEVLSARLLMTVSYIFSVMSLAFAYGSWPIFLYSFAEGRNGKASQNILYSVCYMPFSIEKWAEWVKHIAIQKIKLVGGITFLILAVGMFVGEYTDDGIHGIGFYLPENVFQSLAVCIVGTLLVVAFIYIGYAMMKTTMLKRYWKKRNGGKTRK